MKNKANVLIFVVIVLVICSSCSSTTGGAAGSIPDNSSSAGALTDNKDNAVPSAAEKSEPLHIRFNSDFNYQQYDGETVIIRGYMATLSPVDGRFIYLMNLPYQNCPFCLPNTSTIVNTVAVYAKNGKKFEFYDGPIEVIGDLKVEDSTDEFGYSYSFRIDNAAYVKLDTNELSENLKTYGALAQDGIFKDILDLFNQVSFNMYFEFFEATKDDIKIVSDTAFDDIIRRINAISNTDYPDLILILEDLKQFNQSVNTNIKNEEFEKNSDTEMDDAFRRLADTLFVWLNMFEI